MRFVKRLTNYTKYVINIEYETNCTLSFVYIFSQIAIAIAHKLLFLQSTIQIQLYPSTTNLILYISLFCFILLHLVHTFHCNCQFSIQKSFQISTFILLYYLDLVVRNVSLFLVLHCFFKDCRLPITKQIGEDQIIYILC